MYKKIFTIFCLILFLQSCMVTPYVSNNFYTKSPKKIWYQGKELVQISNESCEITINFEKAQYGDFSFKLKIKNISSDTINIIPEKIFCQPINSTSKIYAKNPEIEIAKLNKKIELKHKEQSEAECMGAFGSCLNFLALFSSSPEEYQVDNDEFYEDAEKYEIQKKLLENDKREILRTSLRKTSLLPDQTVSGNIIFHLSNRINAIEIKIPINEKIISTEFYRGDYSNNNYSIKLSNQKILYGNIFQIKNKLIYLESNKILYKINQDKIDSIFKDEKKISLEKIDYESKKIDYNEIYKIKEIK